MEAFAGFTEHTDREVGRLVDAIDEIGVLDNTLFIYIMGDNGSSGEGGLTGTYNELIHLNGIFDAETTESMLEGPTTGVAPIRSHISRRPGRWLRMHPLRGPSRWPLILAVPATAW